MKDIVIRNIASEDFEYIYMLNCELGYSYEKDRVKQRIDFILEKTSDIILVAEEESEVVGYIHGESYELLYHDSMVNILGFVVRESLRGQGIGHKLICRLEEIAIQRGFSGIRLTSGSTRVSAHKFYESHGYINRKEQKNFVKIFE